MKCLIIILFFYSSLGLSQVILDSSSKISISTSTEVEVFQQKKCALCYYYLPTNLQMSFEDGDPEISFLKWEAQDDTKAGAILNFLIKWELSKAEQDFIQKSLTQINQDSSILMGPIHVDPVVVSKYFIGSGKLVDLLNNKLVSMPPLPTTPGSKMAFSFRFSGNEVQEFIDALSKMYNSDSIIRLPYSYMVSNTYNELFLELPLKHILGYL